MVPSREALKMAFPAELNRMEVTPSECSEKVTEQNPLEVFHNLTCWQTKHIAHWQTVKKKNIMGNLSQEYNQQTLLEI